MASHLSDISSHGVSASLADTSLKWVNMEIIFSSHG